ncbi:MAG TPA: hypothetical protein PLA44_05275 [Propionibacteriaceae bacterium]|nr:hypothetical protein [Propionibacteriaceae bacterium]
MSAQQAAPDPDQPEPTVEWAAYPPQLEVQKQKPASEALLPYTPPVADVPDEVEVRVRPTWRAYVWAIVVSLFSAFMLTGALTSNSWIPLDVFLVLLLVVGSAAAAVASLVRPTRIRVDGEGLLIKPRLAGFSRPVIRVPWHSITELVLDTQTLGSGKSRRRVTFLRWQGKPGVTFQGVKNDGTNRWSLELGDVDDDPLAAVLARYQPPKFDVRDTSSWF